MPRISIVVPIYNVEPYLEECLESIARQTYKDLEVVMVDDGSKDNSPAIAERFASRDDRQAVTPQAISTIAITAPAAPSTSPRFATIQLIARPATTWNSSGRFSCLRSIRSATNCLLQDAPFSRNSPAKSIAV